MADKETNRVSLSPLSSQEEIIELAVEEGHDADIPSNLGYIARQRPASAGGAHSLKEKEMGDLEKGEQSAEHSVVEEEQDVRAGEEEPTDPDTVWWDGPDDPQNPMNWSEIKKWATVAAVSGITFLTPLASSMFAPGVPELMKEFHRDSVTLEGFVISIYVLGFAFGPLIIAPLSEMYGRNPLYHTSTILFTIFTVACAVSTNLNMFIVFRFFQGCFGGAPLALGGGTIADTISRENRATAMAVWMMGPTVGPAIGPIIGGFLTQAKGWRWNFWLVTIVAGCFCIGNMIFLRESYAPAILARKAARLRQSTGNPKLKSKLDSGLTPKDLFFFSIIRPTKMLTRSPIVFMISLYNAITYAYIYIMFTTFTPVFEKQYGWSTGIVGLSFLGMGLGSISGQFGFTYFGNRTMRKHLERGDAKPEHRLNVAIFGAFFIPVGLFVYGWTAEARVHWIVPQLGTAAIGFGMLTTFMSMNTYLVDVFTAYAASAMAANTVLRSLFASLIGLGGEKMYNVLGLGWGNSLLGFVAVAMIPIPFLFWKFGEKVRTKWTVKL